MRLICSGSRDWDRQDVVDRALDILAEAAVETGDGELEIVHGACFPAPAEDGSMPLRSADWLVELWARRWNRFDLRVRIERWPANYARHKRAAERLRNVEMAKAGGDLLLVFGVDESAATAALVETAEREEITTRLFTSEDLPAVEEVAG